MRGYGCVILLLFYLSLPAECCIVFGVAHVRVRVCVFLSYDAVCCV